MAVTAFRFGLALLGQYSTTAARRVDWDADTIKTGLTTSSYTPAQDTHDFYNDITNELTTTGGYTAGGVALTTSAPTYTAGTNTMSLDASDAQWTSASFTARYGFVYKDTGTSSTSPLLVYIDFGADQTVSSGTFTLQWDSQGVAVDVAA